jgi:hypothetical protein
MYHFSRYQAKELALAYMSGKQHELSPLEFLQQLKAAEKSFDHLLKYGIEQPHEVIVKNF